jgi:hypothetical protein
MTLRQEQGLTPKERADAARQRFLEAVSNLHKPAGMMFDRHRKESVIFLGVALVAGFVVGYSPQIRRICMTSLVDFVWDFVLKR